jgi:hypothetical protein
LAIRAVATDGGVWGYSTAKSMAFVALQQGFPR